MGRGRPRKYATEEERKEARRKYYQEHKEEIAEQHAKWYQEHKDEIAEYRAKYLQEHKAERAETLAKYRQKHKKEIAEYDARYRKTKEGRAVMLINRHKEEDKKYNRGNCDLTMPWFVRNIFTKCIYCGETDWKKLGCDRIDNNLPHTSGNVVPCCAECNCKRQKKPFEQFYMESKHQNYAENICLV